MARSNGRSPGTMATASSGPIATPSPPARAARTRRASRPRSSAASRPTPTRGRQQARAGDHRGRRDAASCAAMLSVFIREPEFVGPDQGPPRLGRRDARIVENAIRDPFDHWLAGSAPAEANKLLEWVIGPGRGSSSRRKQEARGQPQERGAQAPPPRQARRLVTERGRRAPEIVHRRGRFGRRLGQNRPATGRRRRCCRCAGKSSTSPMPAARRPRRISSSPISSSGARRRHPVDHFRDRRPPLRQDHHHDGRRRRRRPHRLAPHHLLLPGDAGADPRGPPLPRRPAALPDEPRRHDGLRPRRRPSRRADDERFPRGRPRSTSAASRASARCCRSSSARRRCIRSPDALKVCDREPEATRKTVERLMGNKPEERFAFIQERAEFAPELDLLTSETGAKGFRGVWRQPSHGRHAEARRLKMIKSSSTGGNSPRRFYIRRTNHRHLDFVALTSVFAPIFPREWS